MILQKFPSHVDSIDCACEAASVSGVPEHVVVATSSLEGSLWDGGLHLLNAQTGSLTATAHCLVGISTVRVIPFSSYSGVGEYSYSCISCMDDGKMAIHAVQSSSGFSCSAVINAHNDCVSALSVNGSVFVSASWDGSIKCWDMNCTLWHPTQSIIDAHQKPVNDISISPSSGSMLSSVGQDGFLRLWDTRDNMDASGCVHILGAREPISCVLWDLHDEHRIYVGTDSGRVLAYDTRISSRSRSSDDRGSSSGSSRSSDSSRLHRGRVRRMRGIQDQRDVLLTGSDDCSVLALRTSSIPLLSSSRTSSGYCSGDNDSAVLDR